MKYSQGVYKNLISIIVTAIVFGMITFALSEFFITPEYESSITLFVNNRRGDAEILNEYKTSSADIVASQQLVPTYVEIIKSDTVLQEVCDFVNEKTGENFTVGKIRKMLTVEAVMNTEIIRVSVRTTESAMAREIANTIASIAPDKIQKFIERSDVKIIDKAKLSTEPVSPNVRNNTILGALLGLVLGTIFFILRGILRILSNIEEKCSCSTKYF